MVSRPHLFCVLALFVWYDFPFSEIKVHEIFLKFRAKGKQTYQHRHGWRWFYVASSDVFAKQKKLEATKCTRKYILLCKEVVPCGDETGIVKTGVCSFCCIGVSSTQQYITNHYKCYPHKCIQKGKLCCNTSFSYMSSNKKKRCLHNTRC